MTDVYIPLPPSGSGGVTTLNGETGAVTIQAGTGITVTNGSGTITIASTASGGTVTSVALADGSIAPIYGISGSPVTTSGTLTFSLFSQSPNTFLSGPTTGPSAQPAFRGIVNSDLSSITSLPNLVLTAGQVQSTVTSESSNFTAAGGTIYLVNTTSSAISAQLPAPSSGLSIRIKDSTGNANTNNITILRHASENIEGLASSYLMQTNWGSIQLISDGTNWWLI